MTVKELVAQLAGMPQDAEVAYLYDGALRGDTARVYVSKSGVVALADHDEIAMYSDDREE